MLVPGEQVTGKCGIARAHSQTSGSRVLTDLGFQIPDSENSRSPIPAGFREPGVFRVHERGSENSEPAESPRRALSLYHFPSSTHLDNSIGFAIPPSGEGSTVFSNPFVEMTWVRMWDGCQTASTGFPRIEAPRIFARPRRGP